MKMKIKSQLIILLCFFSLNAFSSIIIPFLNLGEVMKNSDVVVYGEVFAQNLVDVNGNTNEQFQLKSVLNIKGNASTGTIFNIKNYHVFEQDREAQVWGDLSLDVNKKYLLFLKESNTPGVYVAICMSYYCFEELEIDNERYLVPSEESRDIHLAERPDGKKAEEMKAYKKSDLLKYLALIRSNPDAWNQNDKIISVSDEVNEKILNRVNPPSHCTFLSSSEPWSRWTGFKSQTLPVRYRTGGDAGCSDAITYTQDAVTELNINYTGIALTNSGPFSGYTPNCTGGNAYGGNFTSYIDANLGGSRNVCVIYNDPCSEIPDLISCGGTLAIGGHYMGGSHNHQGKSWQTAGYGFVVVNNNTGSCYCSVGTYQIMMEHEITHTLGIGHIDSGNGTANMNPSCCNNITQKDKDCLDYTYPLNLPVELITFYGTLRNSVIELFWETASELSNKEYVIEQSSNGIDFLSVRFIDATGTSNSKSAYATKIPAISGDNYVRLAQIDFDGMKTYIGNVLSFNAGGQNKSIKAYYSSSLLKINLPDDLTTENMEVNVYNTVGIPVATFNSFGENKLEYNIGNLPSGFYVAEIKNDKIRMSTYFIKSN